MFHRISFVILALSPLVVTGTELKETASGSDRGFAWNENGSIAAVATDFNDANKANNKNAAVFNGMAWIRATSPNENYRDGKLAVDYATKACTLSEWKNPKYLTTLAVAYAELEDFTSAIEWQERAVELAPSGQKKSYTVLLERFREHKPYRNFAKHSTQR